MLILWPENHQDDVVAPVEGVASGGTAFGWNDATLHDTNPCNGSTDPTEIRTADLVHVWCMPSTANIGSQEMPRHLEHINLLAARNERERFQIAIRPKVSWAGSRIAGSVQVHCGGLCSTSGDRLVIGQSLTLRHTVPILGVPDALVPLNLPVSQLNLSPGEAIDLWVSVDVPSAQPPCQYEGEICITSIKPDVESSAQFSVKYEKHQLNSELKSCLNIIEPVDGKSSDDVVERVRSTTASLRRLLLSPLFSEFFSDNGPVDMMGEDVISNLSL